MCGCSYECAIFASVSLHILHMHERNWLIIGHTQCWAAGYQSRLGILKTGPHLISWCICNLEFMTADLSLTISSPKNIVWGTLLDITGQLLNYILPMCMLCIVFFFIACHEFNLQKVLYKEILFTYLFNYCTIYDFGLMNCFASVYALLSGSDTSARTVCQKQKITNKPSLLRALCYSVSHNNAKMHTKWSL